MSRLPQIQYFIQHLWKSRPAGHIQTPFLFNFAENVLLNHKNYYTFSAIEKARKDLLQDRRILEIEDFGAGSHTRTGNQRSVSSIAKTALIPPAWGAFLFRLIEWGKYRNMLELGTSLGISAAYMAGSSLESKVLTMEGSQTIADIAKETWNKLGLSNVEQIVGPFDQHLAAICEKNGPFDLVHIDGNHRYEPTMKYFNQLLPYMSSESVMVLDDIHWSREMHQAWSEISARQDILLTVDLFYKGLVFFHSGLKYKEAHTFTLSSH